MNNYMTLASFADSPVVQHLGGLSPPNPPANFAYEYTVSQKNVTLLLLLLFCL